MAPKTKIAPKASNKNPKFKPQEYRLTESGSDNELQVAKKPSEPESEGFGAESSDDDEESVDIVMEDDIPALPKDDSEEELERLVFGDSMGFREGVRSFAPDESGRGMDIDTDEEDEDKDQLSGIADQDLFFFDSGPGIAPPAIPATDVGEDEEEERPAWEDSDDERLSVSLLARKQNKKLRDTEADDVISGKDYIRRLRRQYTALYPTPEWALHAYGKAKRKRRSTADDEESGAESGSDVDMDNDDQLSTEPLARLLKDADILSRNSRGMSKRRKLQAGTVDIQRLKDVSQKGPSAITSLSFHPTYPLLLSSGPSSTLYLHHVKPNPPDPNPLLTSLHIKGTPLATTAFHPSATDSRIFLSARRRYFHVWNLSTGIIEKISRIYGHQHEQRTMEYFSLSPNGKYMALRGSSRKGGGVINVLDATSLQWITQARIESRGGVADFAWWNDGSGMSIVGKNGEVTEWSVEEGVVGRWMDEGAIGITVIALGGKSGRDWIGGDRWVAIGSSSGIVNIYDRRAWVESQTSGGLDDPNGGIPKTPKPVRALENLTTPVSHLHFSPDGQILAMASRWKHNAMRLVHLPSATVFKNWPTEKTPLGRISAVAWGRPAEEDEKEGSLALLAVGSESGRVKLWEVRA